MKISFLGDISLNDSYNQLYKNGLNPFTEVIPILQGSDFVIGNLECLAGGESGENLNKNPRLTASVETLYYLLSLNVRLVSLANNHIYDHLEDGFNKTTEFLTNNGIRYLGAGLSAEDASNPYIIKKNGISIGFLNYVTEDTNPALPENASVKLNMFEIQKAKNDIQKIKPKVDHLVLLLHWGGKMEGSLYPHIEQPKIARNLIDAGADLIVGHHSHTLQPFERYNSRYIFYSLGNFCFADVIINGRRSELDKKRTNPSIVLNVEFFKSYYSIMFHGIKNCNGIIKNNYLNQNKVKHFNFQKLLLYKNPVWSSYYLYEKRIYPIVAYFFANKRNPIKQLYNLKRNSLIKHLKKILSFNKRYS